MQISSIQQVWQSIQKKLQSQWKCLNICFKSQETIVSKTQSSQSEDDKVVAVAKLRDVGKFLFNDAVS